MSDLDLTPEAVERLARECNALAFDWADQSMGIVAGGVRDTLRALSARLAEAEARARESALDALAAYGQAAEAYEAQLRAEAITARAVRLALERSAKDADRIAGNTLDFPRDHRRAAGQCAAAIRAMATDEAVAAIIKEASDG